MKPMRALAPFCVAVMLFSSAACTKSDGDAKTTTTVAKAAEAPTSGDDAASGDGHVSSPALVELPSIEDAKGIRSDTTLATCSIEPGDVAASGTVTNRADAAADILVTVNWINATDDVVARGFHAIEAVEAGETVDWEAATTLDEGFGAVSCVLNVKSGTLA